MDDRAGGGVQFPLDEPVLRPQLHHFALAEQVRQRPAAPLRLEQHGQLEGGSDARVGAERAQGLQPVLGLDIDSDEGPSQAAGLIGGEADHVPGDARGHVTREQQRVAVQRRRLGGR